MRRFMMIWSWAGAPGHDDPGDMSTEECRGSAVEMWLRYGVPDWWLEMNDQQKLGGFEFHRACARDRGMVS